MRNNTFLLTFSFHQFLKVESNDFWPGLGLPSKDHSSHTKIQLLPKQFTKKNEPKCEVPLATT